MPAGAQVDFQFARTTQSDAFFTRNPKFLAAFERLITLMNKCFGRTFQAKDVREDISFNLGQTCSGDFLEIVFLATNGYGIGALKTLRGLYERAVALAYMIKHPEKADRFAKFAAIQEYKAIKTALTIVPESELELMMNARGLTISRAREWYDKFKSEYQITDCKKCKTKRMAISWDIDLSSMVKDVGEPYDRFYLGAYTLPNFHVHATLASILPNRPSPEQLAERNRREGYFSVLTAFGIMTLVANSQNSLFALGLAGDVAASDVDLADLVSHL
jgi:hypothetical protein